MQNNTTFSNRESLQQRLPSLPANDTFSNKVSLDQILVSLGSNNTFSNGDAVDSAIPPIKPPKKDEPKGKGDEGAFKS